MELTWTDAVFSRIAMVLFCAEMKVLKTSWKFTENISGKYEKYLRKDPPEGTGQWATSPVAAAPLAAATRLVGPTWLCRPQSQLCKFTFA